MICPNGCCGDINHFDWSRPAPQSGQWRADRSGMVLTGEVTKCLPDLTSVEDTTLTAATVDITAALRVPSDEDVAWATKVVGGQMHGFDAQGLVVVKAHRMLNLREAGETQRARVAV